MRSHLPSFFISWQYVVTAITHPLPLLFLLRAYFPNINTVKERMSIGDVHLTNLDYLLSFLHGRTFLFPRD